MGLGKIFDVIKDVVSGHPEQILKDVMGGGDDNAQAQNDQGQGIQSSSQDPYGDPADHGDTGHPNILGSSQDPLGDPADQGAEGNIKSSSEDPYGDPADQRR